MANLPPVTEADQPKTLADLKREFLITYNELERFKTKHLWTVAHAPTTDARVEEVHAQMMQLLDRLTQLDDLIQEWNENDEVADLDD